MKVCQVELPLNDQPWLREGDRASERRESGGFVGQVRVA